MRNAMTVGAFTALSRVLGLLREMLQSRVIGAGVAQSAFTLAFALPNTMRKIFGEGALTAAFVPVFKTTLQRDSPEVARRLVRAVATVLLLSLVAILIVVFGALEALEAVASGWCEGERGRLELTLSLVRTLAPYLLFICAAAFGMGVVNALGRFKAAAFMPCLLNFCWIGALAVLAFDDGSTPEVRVRRVAWAILGAGALQMLFMARQMAKHGFSPVPVWREWWTPRTREVWRNTALAALGAGAVHFNYLLDQALAQLAAPWAAGVIGYAERLMDLPIGIVAVAFGTVLLPTLSDHFARGDRDGARQTLSKSLVASLAVMLPASAALSVVAHPAVAAVYAGGAFDSVAVVRVARALAVYALSLGFFSVQKVMVPYFQAQHDMRTPLRISLCTVAANATLNVLAVWLLPEEFRHVGLAASTGICAMLGAGLLLAAAFRRDPRLLGRTEAKALARILAAALAVAAAIILLRPWARSAAAFAPELIAPWVELAVDGAAAAAVLVFTLGPLLPRFRRCG